MLNIVAGHVPVTGQEFVELALGFDVELFAGTPEETRAQRAARLDVAHVVLDELRAADPEAAAYAAALLRTRRLPCRTSTRQRRPEVVA